MYLVVLEDPALMLIQQQDTTRMFLNNLRCFKHFILNTQLIYQFSVISFGATKWKVSNLQCRHILI